jgi:hypothetical protein
VFSIPSKPVKTLKKVGNVQGFFVVVIFLSRSKQIICQSEKASKNSPSNHLFLISTQIAWAKKYSVSKKVAFRVAHKVEN